MDIRKGNAKPIIIMVLSVAAFLVVGYFYYSQQKTGAPYVPSAKVLANINQTSTRTESQIQSQIDSALPLTTEERVRSFVDGKIQ